MPDVGDEAILTLTVNPFDVTTAAIAVVTSAPTGATLPDLTPVTANGGATWTVNLPLAVAGAWEVLWTVTGQGSGVERDTVFAFGPVVGRTYATLSELANYLHDIPPVGADRLLVRATRKIDSRLRGAVYPVTDAPNFMPIEEEHRIALRDAVCAQVEWWDEQGDSTGSGAAGMYGQMRIGNVTLGKAGGGGSTQALAADASGVSPIAVDILLTAGLLPITAWMWG